MVRETAGKAYHTLNRVYKYIKRRVKTSQYEINIPNRLKNGPAKLSNGNVFRLQVEDKTS